MSGSKEAPWAHEASPEFYTLVHESEGVRLLRMLMSPGDADAWHRHPEEVVYFIRGGKLRILLEDGTSVEREVPDGAVVHNQPWSHQVTNIGDSVVEAIVVEKMH